MNDETPPRLEKPTYLTNFLIAMAHSPELVSRLYARDDDALKAAWNLTDDHLELLRNGNLQAIHEAVTQELPEGVYVTAAIWIGISKWPIPWPWIGA
jgi:hypothetical protein